MCAQDWPHACFIFDVFLLPSVVRYSCVIIRQGWDLLVYLSLSAMRCISTELAYVCQRVGVWIGKWLPNYATTDNTASHTGFTEIGSSHEI